MAPLLKIASPGFDQHNDIDNNPGKYVEAVEAGNGKEEVGKIGARLAAVGIHERIPSPPGAFAMQVRPFPCLAAQESKTAQDGQEHIEHYFLLVHGMAGAYRQYHGNRAHDEDEGHQTHEHQW